MFFGLMLGTKREDKISISLSAFHLNATLGLYLATEFFSKEVVLVLISLQLVLDATIAFFRWFTSKYI